MSKIKKTVLFTSRELGNVLEVVDKFEKYPPSIETQLRYNGLKKLKIRDFRNYVAPIYQKKIEILWHEWG